MDALVSFAESIYRAPGVEPGLLTLQDRYGLDVCVVLACAWYGARGGGRLNPEQIDLLEEAVAEWRVQVIQPLRGVRRVLKGDLDQGEITQGLRAKVKGCEIDAERIELQRLEQRLGNFPQTEQDKDARVASAAGNILVYLREGEAPLGHATRQTLVALLGAIFPDMEESRLGEVIDSM